jgi:hypothetical protein
LFDILRPWTLGGGSRKLPLSSIQTPYSKIVVF